MFCRKTPAIKVYPGGDLALSRHYGPASEQSSLTRPIQGAKIFLYVNNSIDIEKWIMRIRDFQRHVKDLPAFNLNDIRKFDPDFHRQQLSDWLNRGYIRSLAGGLYLLADVQVDERTLFMLANRLYEPSYISRESALAHYLVIPESVLGMTSVSSRKTRQFDSKWGRFSYSSIKPTLMFGYRIVVHEQLIKYKIASLEKAVLDYLYWNSRVDSHDDFAGLRWNRQELHGLEDNPLFKKYLTMFDNRALDRRVDLLMEYIHA